MKRSNAYHITVQRAAPGSFAPLSSTLKKWAKSVLEKKIKTAEVTLRIVTLKEITDLNTQYRNKKKPTNVLSFPFDMPEEIDEIFQLGDIVICADIVNQEAAAQNKSPEAHWAHMVASHGTLHLLGYDHEIDADAILMESEEILILQSMGFLNPYK